MGWLYAGSHLPPAPALIGSLPPLSASGSHTSESWGLKPRSDEAAPLCSPFPYPPNGNQSTRVFPGGGNTKEGRRALRR